MARYPVAVARAEKGRIRAGVERAIDMLGGIGEFVRPGDFVLIKVNMSTRATPESGLITHPAVATAVARLCSHQRARTVIIERTPNLELNLEPYSEIFRYSEVVCIDQARHTPRGIPNARSLRDEVDWADIIDEADVFINIPGLRTHALTRFSNAMQNLLGLLPRDSARRAHMCGLEGSIVDLNAARPSDLIISDAVYTLQGNYPSESDPVYTGFITAATNVVAADLVAARTLDIDPAETAYLALAHQRGLGPASLAEVDLLGDDLDEVLSGVTIAKAPGSAELTGPLASRHPIHAEHACAACRQALAGGILAAEAEAPELLASMPGVAFVCGPQPEDPRVTSDHVLYFGNCVYCHSQARGAHIPGCPPLSEDVLAGLREMAPRRPHASMCSISWRDTEASLPEIIRLVAEAGYEGIELWGTHLDDYLKGGGSLGELKALLDQAGLLVPMVSPYLDLAGDPAGSLETGARFVAYAVALGAPLVRVFTKGGASALAKHAVWLRVVGGLKSLCALGRDVGVGFCLETHQNHLHDTVATTLRMIRQTGAPNLFVNLDIHNLFDMGEDPILAARRLMPHTRIMHLKNARHVNGRRTYGVPLAQGNMDYAPFLAEVLTLSYGGFASIEWFGDDPARAAGSELAFLRAHWPLG